jgi:hypothetical protein
MRMSTQVRTLAEMALVRICHLQDLDEISTLIEQLKSGGSPASGAASKKNEPVRTTTAAIAHLPLTNGQQPRALPGGNPEAPSSSAMMGRPEAGAAVAPASYGRKLDGESAESVWRQALEKLTGIAADCAACATKLSVDNLGRLVASFPESQKFSRDTCLRPSNLSRIESALSEVCGGRVGLVLTTHHEPADAANALSTTTPRKSVKQQQVDVAAEPFVQRAVELFDGDSSRLRYLAPDAGSKGQ